MRRDKIIPVRVSTKEKSEFKKIAKQQNVSLSKLIRNGILRRKK